MKTIRSLPTGLLLAVFVSAAGCATVAPPADLLTARSAYDRASHGPAASLAAADMHAAKETLAVAEQSFTKNGDTQETRDTAYIAARRAQIAEAHARTVQATEQTKQTNTQLRLTETSNAQVTSAKLGRAKTQLALQGQQLQNADRQLDTERQRREEADKRAAQAAADLAKFATVKQEPRGMVITLSGSVLFASNKSDLLPAARMRLNEVADALNRQDSKSTMVVEGYTDSQGTPGYNQDLSQRRARSVRDYLISRGIASGRVTAEGFGLNRPVADNESPEGRANNRRVEIVVKPQG
jgi:outer membrane protein OmpA-like peptidoglycan-associated protein